MCQTIFIDNYLSCPREKKKRHFTYNLNFFTSGSQTRNNFILGRKTLYESYTSTGIRKIPSLSARQAKRIAFFVLQDTVYFPNLNVPYIFFWFCLISVSVMDVENWMPYARNNHSKAKCRGYVMSLFIQLKPACVPFCLLCCSDKFYCHRSQPILCLTCRINAIYISHSWAYTTFDSDYVFTICLRQSSQDVQITEMDSLTCYSSYLCLLQSVLMTIWFFFFFKCLVRKI